jgi:hypothetical protein
LIKETLLLVFFTLFLKLPILEKSLSVLGKPQLEPLKFKTKEKPFKDKLKTNLLDYFCHMSTHSCYSRHFRGQSPEFDPFLEIGRKKEIIDNLQSKLRRFFFKCSSKIRGIYVSSPPGKPTMTSSGGGFGISSGSTSSQASTSSLMGSMYNHYNHVVSATNPTKVIKQFGLFKFEEDLDATMWHVPSQLNLALATTPLPKFKDHLPKFSRNGTI